MEETNGSENREEDITLRIRIAHGEGIGEFLAICASSASDLDPSFIATLGAMPSEEGQEFRTLVARIADADFRWTPFFLTSTPPPSDPTRYSARLRQAWALLNEGQIIDEAQRDGPEAREANAAGGAGGVRSRSSEP